MIRRIPYKTTTINVVVEDGEVQSYSYEPQGGIEPSEVDRKVRREFGGVTA